MRYMAASALAECARILRVAGEQAQADAGAHGQGLAVNVQRRLEGVLQLGHDLQRGLFGIHVFAQHRELVPGQPGDGVHLARRTSSDATVVISTLTPWRFSNTATKSGSA